MNSTGIEKLIGALLWKTNRNRQNIQIHRRATVGYGLYIGHNGPVVVNPTAILGNNVNLSQFTTIGAIDGDAAVIGEAGLRFQTYAERAAIQVDWVTARSRLPKGRGHFDDP